MAVHRQNYNIKTLSLSVIKPPESSIKPQESKKEIISLESLHVKCALPVEISSDDFKRNVWVLVSVFIK